MHKLGRKIIIIFDFLSIFFVFFMIIFSHNSAFPEPYFVIKKNHGSIYRFFERDFDRASEFYHDRTPF